MDWSLALLVFDPWSKNQTQSRNSDALSSESQGISERFLLRALNGHRGEPPKTISIWLYTYQIGRAHV